MYRVSIFFLGILGLVLLSSAVHARILDLADAFERVEEANLTVLVQQESVLQALEAVRRERAGLLPRVDLGLSQTRRQSANVGTGFDAFGLPPRFPASNRFDAQLTGSVFLIHPELIARYQSARQSSEVARYAYEGFLQEMLYTTARVYFTHLRNLERFEVINANIERARVLRQLAQDRLEVGAATRIDVTRAEVQLATQEQALLQQQTVVLESGLLLRRFLTIGLEDDLDLRATRLERIDGMDTSVPGGVVAEAFERRPDFLAARQTLEVNRLERRAARWERFPSILLFAEYGYAAEEAFDGDYERAWAAGVALSMPIFEGLRIRANEATAASRFRQQQFRIDDLKTEIQVELRARWQDVRSRAAQITVAEKNHDLAREELVLAEERFRQGVTSNRELVDAQNGLAQAADNLVEATFFYHLARLELALARGDIRSVLDLVAP